MRVKCDINIVEIAVSHIAKIDRYTPSIWI